MHALLEICFSISIIHHQQAKYEQGFANMNRVFTVCVFIVSLQEVIQITMLIPVIIEYLIICSNPFSHSFIIMVQSSLLLDFLGHFIYATPLQVCLYSVLASQLQATSWQLFGDLYYYLSSVCIHIKPSLLYRSEHLFPCQRCRFLRCWSQGTKIYKHFELG